MVGQNNKDSLEELSFGKIGKNKSGQKYPHEYAILHLKTTPWIERDLVGIINYDAFVGYIRGAYFGKFKEDLSLYNGISEVARDNTYQDVKFLPFKEAELQKLIKDAEIPDRFNIRTIK
jgi:hypothetical protein